MFGVVVVVVVLSLFCSIQWLWFCVSVADIIYERGKDNERGGKGRKGSENGFLVFPRTRKRKSPAMNSIYFSGFYSRLLRL